MKKYNYAIVALLLGIAAYGAYEFGSKAASKKLQACQLKDETLGIYTCDTGAHILFLWPKDLNGTFYPKPPMAQQQAAAPSPTPAEIKKAVKK